MKTKHLLKNGWLKPIYFPLFIISIFLCNTGYSQTETHDMVTYDTTFRYNTAKTTPTFTLRITRPVNMFTANHPDTASRPVIITMPGQGEVGTDKNNLAKFGPHYFLKNGWDGSVQLANGTHYPILITVLTDAQNVRPQYVLQLMQFLVKTYHIKKNSVHIGGLSMGGFTWGRLIAYSAYSGDETAMSMIKSYTSLQGVAADNFNGVSWGVAGFGQWAKKYGGKFFGLEGSADTRNVWQVRDALEATTPGSGYFSYETIGGGTHCCWNSMYDPAVKDWQSVGTITNANLAVNRNHDNSMGTYKKGSSIFQWMLRQGDTTLVGSGVPPPPPVAAIPTVNAGPTQTIQLPIALVTLSGTASADPLTALSSVTWTRKSGPSSPIIVSALNLITLVTGLVEGTYVFTLTAKDKLNQTNTSDVSIVVKPLLATAKAPVVAAGADLSIQLPINQVTLSGTATADPLTTLSSVLWTRISGPSTPVIVSASTASTSVTGLVEGTYAFVLTAKDKLNQTTSDTVNVTVKAAAAVAKAPVVNAGADQSIQLPVNQVTLSGTATADPLTTLSSVLWTRISGPSTPVIVSASTASTSVTGLAEGTYAFALTAKDKLNQTTTDTVNVIVKAAVIVVPPPVKPAGSDLLVGEGEYQIFFIDSLKHLWGLGNLTNIGTNKTGVNGVPQRVKVTPADLKFKFTAGALHGGASIDTAGNVWTMGDNYQAHLGIGNITDDIYTPQKIATDINGKPFTNVSSVVAFFVKNIYNGWYAVKEDGTLWGWGAMVGGMRGNGTDIIENTLRPTQIMMPGDRRIKQIVAGQLAVALCTDGTVWTWGPGSSNNLGYAMKGKDYTTPHQLTQLSDIDQIAGGIAFNYALKKDGSLYGWGAYGAYMGEYAAIGGGVPKPVPVLLPNITKNLPAKISKIVVNSVCTHVILTDGSLWGWGDNAQGNIGNGEQLDYTKTDQPYTWDYYPGRMIVQYPYNVAPTKKFKNVFGSSVFTFYTYALDEDGQLYNWGRNKANVLANKIVVATPSINATYANGFNVAWPQPVNPFTIKAPVISTSPWCITYPGATSCPTYGIPVNTRPVSKINAASNITTTSTKLDGTGSSDNVHISYYVWSQVSGPSKAIIDLPGAPVATVSGLVTGTYKFKLRVTDNGWLSDSITVDISVNKSCNEAPVANAGIDQSITLPTNSVTLTGTGKDADGTISTYKWAKVSGPATSAIADATKASTLVSTLAEGVYEFELTVSDNNGATGKDTMKVTVNPAPANHAPVVDAGTEQVITLPINTVTLTGKATDDDGTIAGYSWAKISGPAQDTIATPAAAVTKINALVEGVYEFELTAKDDKGAIGKASVKVTVKPAPVVNKAPVASAGVNHTITLPVNAVTLTGTGTDADGSVAAFLWTRISGPATFSIASPTNATTNINNLVVGVYEFELTVTDDKGATDKSTTKVTVNPAVRINVPPVAHAGTTQSITLPVSTVTLTGSGTDTDGTIKSLSWAKVSGPTQHTIVNAASGTTDVKNLVAGTYEFELTVTDNDGATDKNIVKVIVNAIVPPNQLPVAEAGDNKTITLPVNTVSLSGKGTDADGTIASYTWAKVSGPTGYKLSSTTTAATTVTELVEGVYEFELTVKDNQGATDKSKVTVTVLPAVRINQPPVANAGSNQSITLPVNTATLTGSGTDADGTVVSYSWKQVSGPSQATIVSAGQAATAVKNLVEGVYEFELTVKDNDGASDALKVNVTVNPAIPVYPPVADAGSDITITLPSNEVSLNGSNSSDSYGTITSYKWVKISGPSSAEIADASADITSLTMLTEGVYEFELTVTNDKGLSASDVVKVTVNASINELPVANAGRDTTLLYAGSSYTLDGSASYDPDGYIASYSWIKISGPNPFTILNSNTVNPGLPDLVSGMYVFELTVTDDKGAVSKDRVIVIVKENSATNLVPKSDAGVDQTVKLPETTSTLDGSASEDLDGTIASYSWAQVSGPSAALIVTPLAKTTAVSRLVEGEYIFELTVTDDKGMVSTSRIKVVVVYNTGRTENHLTVFPVPTADVLNFSYKSDNTMDDLMIGVFDLNGRKLLGKRLVKSQEAMLDKLDVSSLKAGMYIFQIRNKTGQVIIRKFTKL